MKLLPVHERFQAFQGEGVHMGRSAFFIRLFGCPVHCPWCDSAGTWHKEWVPSHIDKMGSSQLVAEAMAHRPDFIVVTGGEPLIHDLEDLISDAILEKMPVHVETSGGFPIKGALDPHWITLSPKRWKQPIPDMMERADEFKVIVESPDDISFYWHLIEPFYKGQSVWLHPEWSHREDKEVLNAISNEVMGSGFRRGQKVDFRAGWQLHKLYSVDALDNRTKPLVPLGGDLTKGY